MKNSFQESRRAGIGGSDVAVILGVHPYKTVYELWDEKVNGNFKDLSNNMNILYGKLLEKTLLEQRSNKMDKLYKDQHIDNISPYFMLKGCKIINSERSYLFANIDGVERFHDSISTFKDNIVEIKTAGSTSIDRWGPSGGAIVPQEYLCQISHYMMVCGIKNASIVVTFLSESTKEKIAYRVIESNIEQIDSDIIEKLEEIDFSDLVSKCETRTYDFTRDLEFEKIMLDACERFWEYNVQKKIPPEKDYTSKGFQEMIKQKCSTVEPGTVINVEDPELDSAKDLYLNLKEQIKVNTEELNSVTAILKDKIGTCEKAIFSDGSEFLRKVIKRKPYMVPESEYISFTYKGVK